MPEEVKAVETSQNAAPETSGVETNQSNAPEIDYEAEYAALLAENERIHSEKENYKKGLLKAKGKLDDEEESSDIASLVQEEIRKVLPHLEQTAALGQVETILSELAQSEAEKKLIKFHFENSVGQVGSIRERLENAKLIANKKAILKANQELQVALKNKSQPLVNSTFGGGSSGNEKEISDNFWSKEQMNYFQKRGLDPNKVKENFLKHRN